MRRREFITLLGGATSAHAWPFAARAQAQKMLRIGMASVLPRDTPFMIAFEKRMRELGYAEDQNLAVEYLKLAGPAEYAGGMKELVNRHVDIIIAQGPEVTLKAAMAAISSIPIVIVAIDYDPFARGYVTSLAHPTGNVTGIFFQQIELSAKRLEIANGASLTGLFARAAEYVDKLAKGAGPSDLPIEQPTKFQLVLNLKTAKEIGLTIPEATLLRADEVIE
jgi:putative tryptophan/tyrosine transport system substrate-binding protein